MLEYLFLHLVYAFAKNSETAWLIIVTFVKLMYFSPINAICVLLL